jgi:1,4-dihydroxy-2-naphthoyl-CoA synthase
VSRGIYGGSSMSWPRTAYPSSRTLPASCRPRREARAWVLPSFRACSHRTSPGTTLRGCGKWTRKLILKGVLNVLDARRAADLRCDGIMITNHGGRELGGCDLAMICDITIAADTAQFGEPEIEFNSAPPFLIMPWVLGMKHTKELLLLGERVNAQEAHRMGLVNRVVPAGELMAEAKKIALRLARLPAVAMKQNKEAINRAYDMRGLTATLEYGKEMFCLTSMAQSPEGQEFRKIAREQGLKTAIRWRDERFK